MLVTHNLNRDKQKKCEETNKMAEDVNKQWYSLNYFQLYVNILELKLLGCSNNCLSCKKKRKKITPENYTWQIMDFIHLYYLVNIMKKEKRYGTVGTMPKSNSKETESIHNAQFPGLLQALR
jgi:hypothetical protein